MDEVQRYARFVQFKQALKGAQDYLLVGIDVAKAKHYACFMRSTGELLLKRFAFDNTQAGFTTFVNRIRDYQQAITPGETVIGLETTGNYLLPLAQFLQGQGFFVVTVSSLVTKRNRDTLDLSWNKTDAKDAWNVADCLRQGKCLFYHEQATAYAEVKRFMSLYRRLSHVRAWNKVRLQNNVLCIIFPEFTDVYEFVDEIVPMTIMEHFPLPRMIAALPEEEFVQTIVCLTDPTIKKSKLRRLHQLATTSVGLSAGTDALAWELRYIVSEITRLRQVQAKILAEVQQICQSLPEYELLQTIPGIGRVLAPLILGEIGDIRTFSSSRQLIKLAGMDLARIQSGQFEGSLHISKRGRPALRSALHQAAMVSVRHGAPFQLKYLQLLQRHGATVGTKRKALIAIACKLLRIVYHVLKHQQPYREELMFPRAEVGSEGVHDVDQVGESVVVTKP